MSPTLEIKGSIPAIVRNDAKVYQGNLVTYFQTLFNFAHNLTNPYHNFRHICHVLWLCHQACAYYRNDLSLRERRNLLIAAIFHDFDHTGTTGPDRVNIDRALIALDRHVASEDVEHRNDIERLIIATEYPYVVPSENLDLMVQILRDADLSQAFSVAWIQQVVFGLAQEWKMSPIDVLKKQKLFLRNLRYHTKWAQTLFPVELIETKISEAQELVDLLTTETVSA